MIKFENTDVWGWQHAIRGMRNPLNSWAKSDTKRCGECECVGTECSYYYNQFCLSDGIRELGANDLNLMKRLIKGGSEHRKYLRQIMVSVDITAPLYWWKEFDTYKVGTTANSTSTMHKIMSKEFTEDMFSWERMYLLDLKQVTLAELNFLRARYLESKNKADWYCLIQALPSSYNQTRTVTLNYENIYNMYCQRVLVPHKLDEWSVAFKEWCESLPFFKELFLQ